MKIAIIGLGYVGCVSAACLASHGHRVIGVDINSAKVKLINEGISPIVEKDIDKLIADAVGERHLSATNDISSAIVDSDISLICVGTPSLSNGSLDLRYVRNAAEAVGEALRSHVGYHVVAVRSTMLPGSLESIVRPIVESASRKVVGGDIGLCVNPEFLREGSAIADYRNPPFTLVGAWDEKSGQRIGQIYKEIGAPLIQAEIRVAEMLKYSCNVFHALKVGFANELGVLCKNLDIDSHKVMEIFKQDRQLNLSESYLTPGFAFGGSCLPKDIRAINHKAKDLDLTLPILEAILPSNQAQIERAFQMVQSTGCMKVGILGLSFKAGTDDLRESPMVQLAERLLGKGYELKIHDSNVAMANLVGANKQYIEKVIPHLAKLLENRVDTILEESEVLVFGTQASEYNHLRNRIGEHHYIVDLVRVKQDYSGTEYRYEGICW